MKAVGSRVKSNIKYCLSIIYHLSDLVFVCYLGDQSPGYQFVINLHLCSPFFSIEICDSDRRFPAYFCTKILPPFLQRTGVIESRVTTFFHSTLTRTASPGTCCLNENATILAYTNILQIPSHDIGCRRRLLLAINCFREKLQEVFMILFPRASHLPAALCGFPWITTYSFHRLSIYGYSRR